MRIPLAIACVVLGACIAPVSAQDPLHDPVLAGKIRSSLVKIEIVFRDARKRSLGEPLQGQGFFISASGHILTAAHVAIPPASRFSESNAVTYELRISTFSEEDDHVGRGYIPAVLSLPKDIREESIYSELIDSSSVRACNSSTPQPCSHQRIDAANDFIIIKSGIPTNAYIDLVGPYDLEPSFDGTNLGVVSDFYSSEDPEYFAASPSEQIDYDKDEAMFRSAGNSVFVPGVSGSPLIAWTSTPRRGVVAVGVVISNRPDDSTNNRFRAILMGRSLLTKTLAGLASDTNFLSPDIPAWACKIPYAEFPGPQSIARDFLVIAKGGAKGAKKHSRTLRCGRSMLGWKNSFTKLTEIFSKDNTDLIQRLSQTSQINCDPDGSCRIGTGLAPRPYAQIAYSIDNAQQEINYQRQRFEELGGTYKNSCPPGHNCLTSKVFPIGTDAALAAARRIDDLNAITLALKEEARQSRTDTIAAEIALRSRMSGISVSDLLFLYSLNEDASHGADEIKKTIIAIESGRRVDGYSDETLQLLKANNQVSP